MKKLILLCMMFVFSNIICAQTSTANVTNAKAKTEKKIEKAQSDHDKKVKEAISKAKKETNDKISEAKKEVTSTTVVKTKKSEAAVKEDLKETAISRAAEKKVKDKVTFGGFAEWRTS